MYFVTFLLKNLLRRKARSVLTAGGVAVAVGAMVALLGITDGFERSVARAFERRGVDLVVTAQGVINQLSSDLDDSIPDRVRKLPGVRAVIPSLVELVEVQRSGGSSISGFVQGWPPDSYIFRTLKVVAGRPFHGREHKVALLGARAAENLRKQVGDSVEIQGESFRVVGVFESPDDFENGGVILPLHQLQRLMAREGRITGFSVVLDRQGDSAEAQRVREEIEALRDGRGRPLRLSAQPTAEYLRTAPHLRTAHAMAWLTSAVAVIIGGFGMLNTMLMSVLERVGEIGVLRAIGWRKSRVVRMVLGEALLLSLAGAALGAAAAVALTRWLSTFPAVGGLIAGTIAPVVIGEGFVVAVALALLGGVYPAYRAARLLPTEALRHE
jgi:putative ABC transport system permease protein